MRLTVYYATRDRSEMERISRAYGIPSSPNVNGEVDCELTPDTVAAMQPEIDKRLIQLRRKHYGTEKKAR